MNCLPYEVINKKEFRRFSKKEFEHYLIEENSEKKNLQTIKNEVNAKTISYNKNTPKKSNSSYNNYKCLAKLKAFIDSVHFPIVVKPVDLGSSIAVSFVNNVKQLYSAIELVFAYSNSAILEKGIKDVIEYNCSAMKIENSIKVSEIEKPIHKNAILTYADKYGSNLGCKLSYTNSQKLSQNKMHITNIENRKTRKEISTPVNSSAKGMCSLSREFPAKIPVYLRNKIEALTKNAYEIFNCSGIVRCDFIYYKKKVYLNEINSIPGSLAYYLWSTNGYNFSTLLDELIRNSIKNNT